MTITFWQNWHLFNWVDYVIIALVLVSVVISCARGFIRESISLTTWVAALIVSVLFSPGLKDISLLTSLIQSPSLRLIIVFIALFMGVLILGTLVNFTLGRLISKTGLSFLDKVLGLFFGIARGLLLVAFIVLLGGLTLLPQEQWWSGSQLIPAFKPMIVWFQDTFPDQMQSIKNIMMPDKKNKKEEKEKKDKQDAVQTFSADSSDATDTPSKIKTEEK